MAEVTEIKVPDIGGVSQVDVIEVLVKAGDSIEAEAPLVTLESDKASMEIPSPSSGVIKAVKLNIGDKVSEGDVILTLNAATQDKEDAPALDKAPNASTSSSPAVILPEDKANETKAALPSDVPVEALSIQHSGAPSPLAKQPDPATAVSMGDTADILAGPGVRRLARELGVNLIEVSGSGKKERITKEDLQQFVKHKLQSSSPSSSSGIPPIPVVNFEQFGPIETKPLNKIKQVTGEHMHRAWVNVPHVTQFDEADITDLEAFRKHTLKQAEKEGYKLTLLAFISKIVARALVVFPQFNSSLSSDGKSLIYKQYVHIGIAVETSQGLVVPVIKNMDKLAVSDIAKEMSRLSAKARDKGLMPADMQGGCFTISSLGGIGGTAFTPVVNAPEVAILGVSRSITKPHYDGKQFVPRLMLPLSLSYDHRVIDGAEAARFTRFIADGLSDMRRILL